jgi:hypothetical protein
LQTKGLRPARKRVRYARFRDCVQPRCILHVAPLHRTLRFRLQLRWSMRHLCSTLRHLCSYADACRRLAADDTFVGVRRCSMRRAACGVRHGPNVPQCTPRMMHAACNGQLGEPRYAAGAAGALCDRRGLNSVGRRHAPARGVRPSEQLATPPRRRFSGINSARGPCARCVLQHCPPQCRALCCARATCH